MSKYKKLIENKKFISGVYAVTLVTALLILALVIKGPEESGKLIADKNGNIVGINRNSMERSERYDLSVKIDDSGEITERDVSITLQPDVRTGSVRESSDEEKRAAELEAAIDNVVSSIEYSKEKRIRLPSELPDGTALTWSGNTEGPGTVLAVIPLMYLVLVAVMTADALKGDRSEELERKAILRGLPRFCNQLFLMMNAGLILSDAFDNITESYGSCNGRGMSSFEKDLAGLKEATMGHRISTAHVLNEYAVKHDVKELIRIAAILSENEKRGSDVVESLARESRYLWDERKAVAKEYGKAIDTKMSYPLGLLLILLITITMAPALLNM